MIERVVKIELSVQGPDEVTIDRAIEAVLDAGVLQDAINEHDDGACLVFRCVSGSAEAHPDRLVAVSPLVSLLVQRHAYRLASRRAANGRGVTPDQHKELVRTAHAFASALANALGEPTTMEADANPDSWPDDEDFEAQCALGLPDGWDMDRYMAWLKEHVRTRAH